MFSTESIAVLTLSSSKDLSIANGQEFISRDFDLWAYANKVILDFSRHGKPPDNAFIESLNSGFRQECLDQHRLFNLEDAKEKIESWRNDYNEFRQNSSIGNLLGAHKAKFSHPKLFCMEVIMKLVSKLLLIFFMLGLRLYYNDQTQTSFYVLKFS